VVFEKKVTQEYQKKLNWKKLKNLDLVYFLNSFNVSSMKFKTSLEIRKTFIKIKNPTEYAGLRKIFGL